VTNVLMFAAGAAAAYVVVTSPPLRRLAVRAAEIWLGASVPIYLAREVHRAWTDSAAG
jgi:hypothetical protein